MVSSILDSIFTIFREKWWGMMHEVSLHPLPPTPVDLFFLLLTMEGGSGPASNFTLGSHGSVTVSDHKML